MRSLWAINTPTPTEKKFGKHPTQKPYALLLRIIQASTNEGDIVLDPFSGSSTTGLAAYANGRKFIGIDKEKEFLKLSIQRFEDMFPLKREEVREKKHGRQRSMATNF